MDNLDLPSEIIFSLGYCYYKLKDEKSSLFNINKIFNNDPLIY
jgi:hypothetical protein